MSAPSTLPRWADISGAIVTPTSGKLDLGWIPGERPPAQYLNWWMNLVYQWINYLNSNASAGWHDRLPSGTLSGMTWGGTFYNNLTNVAGSIDLIPIYPRVGDVITDIRANTLSSNIIAFPLPVLSLVKVLNGSASTLGSVNMPMTGAWATTSGSLTSPETVADGAAYYMKFVVSVSTGQTDIDSVGYKTGS